jgi:hypothetical protein
VVVDEFESLFPVRARVLDVADVGDLLGEGAHRVRIEVDPGGSGDVVEHDVDIDGSGDRADVVDGLGQCQRLVVRCHDHEHIGAGALGGQGMPDGLLRGGGSGLRDDGDASGGTVDDELDHGLALFGGHGGEFCGRSADDESVDSAVDGPVDNAAERIEVDVLLGVEGGGQGGENTAELGGHGASGFVAAVVVAAADGVGVVIVLACGVIPVVVSRAEVVPSSWLGGSFSSGCWTGWWRLVCRAVARMFAACWAAVSPELIAVSVYRVPR